MESTTTVKLYDLEQRVTKLEQILSLGLLEQANAEYEMIKMHGTYVSKSDAARILGVNRATVYNMLRDGRLDGAMEGNKVSTHSIARYINASKKRGVSDDR